MMLNRIIVVLLILILSGSGYIYSNSFTLISWNLRDFGQSRDDKEIYLIASLLRDADIVAIQEVVAIHPGGAQAVARLVEQLDRMGDNWDYTISSPTKSPSSFISERYAFLWKSSRIKMIGHPRLLDEVRNIVYREPFFGLFQFEGRNIYILNYHSRVHNNKDEESLEINEISNWIISQTSENILWLGDFNLDINHNVFNKIKVNGFKPSLLGKSTTLKSKCQNGNYLSRPEDNIFYKMKTLFPTQSDVIDFVANKNCDSLNVLSKTYSDHLPIFLHITD